MLRFDRDQLVTDRDKGSLHAWEEDDYEANQRKLQLFAERQVAGRNNRQQSNINPEVKDKQVKEHAAIAKTSPKRADKSFSRSRSKSLDKLRKKASSSNTILNSQII